MVKNGKNSKADRAYLGKSEFGMEKNAPLFFGELAEARHPARSHPLLRQRLPRRLLPLLAPRA